MPCLLWPDRRLASTWVRLRFKPADLVVLTSRRRIGKHAQGREVADDVPAVGTFWTGSEEHRIAWSDIDDIAVAVANGSLSRHDVFQCVHSVVVKGNDHARIYRDD